jgi:hypothetical protein
LSKIFLLSPANMRGPRGKQLLTRCARLQASRTLAVTIEDAFIYTSSLYFRGKMAYAKQFVVAPAACGGEGIYIIAPGYGLVRPNWPIALPKLQRLSQVPVDSRVKDYRQPLVKSARALARKLPADTKVVLLGSLMPGKYLHVLRPIFRERLIVPQKFIGMGDMRRGALLLRAAFCGQELEYVDCQTLERPPLKAPAS